MRRCDVQLHFTEIERSAAQLPLNPTDRAAEVDRIFELPSKQRTNLCYAEVQCILHLVEELRPGTH